jgi:Flp pilus assembly secretin CpaC
MGAQKCKLSCFGVKIAAVSLFFGAAMPAFAGADSAAPAVDTLTVTVDQAKIVQLPPGARTLIIGNPMIADVTLLKTGNVMIVTGKGFGETNMIALDAAGHPTDEINILVVGNNNSKALVVQSGMERQSYTCAPRCQPTAVLGDDSNYFSGVAAQIQAHTNDALGK